MPKLDGDDPRLVFQIVAVDSELEQEGIGFGAAVSALGVQQERLDARRSRLPLARPVLHDFAA